MEVLDLVCGMRFESQKAAGTVEHGGTTYYFCGEGCKQLFEQDPESYIKANREGEERSEA